MSNIVEVTSNKAEPVSTRLVDRFCLAFFVVALSGCVTHNNGIPSEPLRQADAVIEVNPDQESIESDAELAQDPRLPRLELDAETLESLLVMNIASYQGAWGLAAKKAQSVASSTKDFRLARLATLLALRDNDYQQGLSSAQLWYELDAQDPDPLNMLLITQLGAGDAEGAKKSVLAHEEGKELDSHIKQVAALLIRQKNRDAGLEVAAFLVSQYPNSAQAALSASFVAENFEDYEQSEIWVEKALELKPGWELAAQMQAKVLLSQQKLEERGEFIAEYVKNHPSSIVMRINYAAELIRSQGVGQALSLIHI